MRPRKDIFIIQATTPDNEDDRLEALHELLILNTSPKGRLDRIVAVAAEEFYRPLASNSLVDIDRIWFKAQIGVGSEGASRKDSFAGMPCWQTNPLWCPMP